jgi:hypothetical protein
MNFKTGFIALALMGLASVVAVGCGGSVCDDAAEVCGVSDGAEDGAEAECTGDAECISQCIVDNDSCDLTATEGPLFDCFQACVGG